ncbi:MAG TPA: glycosyltransferase [Planctomycetota bacterium]|nr:glycosyltransferase [Planctomycetota bacterium]
MIPVVLVLPVLHPAGAERIVADLATRLAAHDFAARVICLEDENAAVGEELRAAGIPVSGLRLSRRRTLACARALQEQLSAERPLIVHSHLFHANMAARMALARMSAPARAKIHLINTLHVAERRFRPWQFAMDRVTARYARVEVCVSKAVAAFQQEKTGLPARFFRVIENGIDLARFVSLTPAVQLPANLNVVSIGRLDPQKDFATLLHAWALVLDRFPAARLSIAGEGPERERLTALISSLRLRNVNLPGFVQDIPGLLQQACLYVQPSAWEGFGLAVAEAMAANLPVIVSDADSLPEVVTDRKTGLVVPKAQPKPLADAIISLLEERALAVRYAAAARDEAARRFSVERMVADYAALYREIACAS